MSAAPSPRTAARQLLEPALVAGTLIGPLVVAWTFAMGLTGWYLDPDLIGLFWVAVAIQAVVLVVTLARTRRGRGYRAQVAVGLIASAVAAVFVFLGSAVFTAIAFPSYFDDLREVREQILVDEGKSEEEIQETLDRIAASQTPTGQAFAGFMGTLGTGLVVSLVASAFIRDRTARPAR